MLGALLAACLYFAAAASDRRDRDALLLAIIAGTLMLQLLVEASRDFVAYTYPWHLARVSAIAVLAAATAVLAAAYAARRFAPGWSRHSVLATAAAAIASVVLVPWFDLKALGAILAGAAATAACAISALKRKRRLDAWVAVAAAAAIPVLIAVMFTAFLDQGYFILLAALLVALVVEQVSSLRRARAERDIEAQRASALAERLARAERTGEPIMILKDGTRSHRVAETDILYLRAADDYCDVALADGRLLLVTMSLARLVEALPPRFVRVHKSHAVNRAHVIAVAPRPGGGRLLKLSDGSSVPVGRSYGPAVAEWTS
jgi:DNA-binding LytR/AlgR family response regulator